MKDKKIFFRIALVLLFCVFLAIELFLYANFVNGRLNAQIEEILEEISKQGVVLVQEEIENQFDILTEIANSMRYSKKTGNMEILEAVKGKYNFRNLGILDKDFNMQLETGDELNLKEAMSSAKGKGRAGDQDIINTDVLQSVFDGNRIITDPVIDISSGEEIILYGVPIYNDNDTIDEILIAIYGCDVLRNIIEVSSFNQQGYSYIVTSDGDMVIRSSNEASIRNVENIFTSLIDADINNKGAVDEMRSAMSENGSGYITFKNGVSKYTSYTPTGIKDWYLLNVIPESVMNKIAALVMRSTYVLCASIILLMGILVSYLIYNERRKNKELNNIIYTDPLTGGKSFAKFVIDAEKILEVTNSKSAIVVMDIDEFKLINELLGYDIGDEALIHIWKYLKTKIGYEELFARSDGDKFVFLLHYKNDSEIMVRIKEIYDELKQKKNKDGYVLKPSFGIYRVDKSDLISIKQMYNFALVALSAIKNGKGDIYAFFTEELSEKMKQDKLMEDMIEEAYKKNEFIVYYQPKYDAVTRRMVGAEALIRWRLSDGNIVPPYKFIPIAENNGFIVKLDKYIFKKVCEHQKKWLDKGFPIVPVSVNLSRKHLYNAAFIYEYKQIVDETELPIEYVQLEITESAVFDNQKQFLSIVDMLHRFGFRILMDDFGTGYSSLMMLKSIPIDILKLDKSFVDDYNDIKGEKIITCITKLAKAINIAVTAEGVETEEQYIFLKNLGCDLIQGYYFARPMPEEDFENELLKLKTA